MRNLSVGAYNTICFIEGVLHSAAQQSGDYGQASVLDALPKLQETKAYLEDRVPRIKRRGTFTLILRELEAGMGILVVEERGFERRPR